MRIDNETKRREFGHHERPELIPNDNAGGNHASYVASRDKGKSRQCEDYTIEVVRELEFPVHEDRREPCDAAE